LSCVACVRTCDCSKYLHTMAAMELKPTCYSSYKLLVRHNRTPENKFKMLYIVLLTALTANIKFNIHSHACDIQGMRYVPGYILINLVADEPGRELYSGTCMTNCNQISRNVSILALYNRVYRSCMYTLYVI